MAEPQPQPAAEPTVAQAPDQQRYNITVDGQTAGFLAYVDQANQRIFYHTVIENTFSGRGLAGRLVSDALTHTREAGMRVVPVCPYVAKYVKSHHDFDDILNPVTPAALTAADAAAQG